MAESKRRGLALSYGLEVGTDLEYLKMSPLPPLRRILVGDRVNRHQWSEVLRTFSCEGPGGLGWWRQRYQKPAEIMLPV